MIKLCKNSKKLSGGTGSDWGLGADAVIPYSTFSYQRKSELEPIPDQLEYDPSKSGRIRMDTHGYGFSCMSRGEGEPFKILSEVKDKFATSLKIMVHVRCT